MDFEVLVEMTVILKKQSICLKDVLMGIPKSDLLGVTVAVIHVAEQYNSVVYIIGQSAIQL